MTSNRVSFSHEIKSPYEILHQQRWEMHFHIECTWHKSFWSYKIEFIMEQSWSKQGRLLSLKPNKWTWNSILLLWECVCRQVMWCIWCLVIGCRHFQSNDIPREFIWKEQANYCVSIEFDLGNILNVRIFSREWIKAIKERKDGDWL